MTRIEPYMYSNQVQCMQNKGIITKAGHHLVEMDISTQYNQYLIGLREYEGGTAAEYHATLKEVLHDAECTATTEPPECDLFI